MPVGAEPPLGAGKRAGDPKQGCIFVPFIEALSVVAAGKEHSGGRQRHAQLQAAVAGQEAMCSEAGGSQELDFLPPSMQSFSQRDLTFVCQFTQVGPQHQRLHF